MLLELCVGCNFDAASSLGVQAIECRRRRFGIACSRDEESLRNCFVVDSLLSAYNFFIFNRFRDLLLMRGGSDKLLL